MATQRSERPRFFEGQYIGAADLSAVVDYTRELAREGVLGGQTWGIAIGLDLVEVAAAGGGFDYFILPGLAWDGYGRPIVVLSPAPVPASAFADLPSGNQRVWLRYDETAFKGLRPGWETCGDEDAFARVRESFAVEVGAFSLLRDRQSGVEIAGVAVDDARRGLRSIDEQAPLVCDGSMPHQAYPEDKARWLVPIGWAAWQAGAPGNLLDRSEAARKGSRGFRRYVGQVAESVYAADGVLRLRDRMTQFKDGDNPEDLCAKSAIVDGDLIAEPDRDDPTKSTTRLVGRELVWVEGHMRVTGDARLFGTKLELRDKVGVERGGVPLQMKRGDIANLDGGEDVEIVLGAAADGKSRLVAGVAEPGKAFASKLQFRNDGRLAVGPVIPPDVKSHTILGATEDHTSLAIAAGPKKTARIQFATMPALAPIAHIAVDDDTHLMRFGLGEDLSLFTYIDTNGRIGVKADDPGALDGDANDLVVKSTANVGMTLLCDPDFAGRINFADGVATSAERSGGYLRYDHQPNRLEFGVAATTRAVIDSQGDVGLGTLAPAARLHIESLVDARRLRIDADRIQAENGGVASLLDLQRNGGGVMFGASLAAERQLFIDSDGRAGFGLQSPAFAIHVRRNTPTIGIDRPPGGGDPTLALLDSGSTRASLRWDVGDNRTYLTDGVGNPALSVQGERLGVGIGSNAPIATLHVRNSIDGDADFLTSHVAVVENAAGGSADVLALKVNKANPDSGNNFITFFGSNGPVGRIEGAGGGGSVALLSGGADFAECLPRDGGAPIGAGRIVGVRNGRVSLATEGADSLLVTTGRAIVVGNAPDSAVMADWERVALIGQVHVSVEGAVAPGDFIVPSGRGDGVGRAVPPGAVTVAQAARVVGRAWEAAPDPGVKVVNVAVGAPGSTTADALASAFSAQATRIAELQATIDGLCARLGR